MITTAKTVSQLATHMAVAFTVMYAVTGSVVFGGIAALLEPVINVLLLPLHAKVWTRIRAARTGMRSLVGLMSQKASQFSLHAGVAFATVYALTGSATAGGLILLVEPLCNVIVLPFHDRAWESLRARTGPRFAPTLRYA